MHHHRTRAELGADRSHAQLEAIAAPARELERDLWDQVGTQAHDRVVAHVAAGDQLPAAPDLEDVWKRLRETAQIGLRVDDLGPREARDVGHLLDRELLAGTEAAAEDSSHPLDSEAGVSASMRAGRPDDGV
eukprot:scaffold88271_cov65-Phaeocystis_antarctica.AAC.2